jgi:hypothetical protein
MKIRSPQFILIPFAFLFVTSSCKNKSPLFRAVSSSHSGIHFMNKIEENDSMNPIDVTNIYNGGGVGVGDFNNDGLQDLYFTGNLVSNKLYLNKGKLKFEDVTEEAGVDGSGKWSRGVAVVDINNDGWLDIYVCATMTKAPEKRKNLLYINQGVGNDGIPKFKEMAAEYGLDDTTHSTMAAFFDYDNDGDLDMYLVVNQILPNDIPSVFRKKITNGSHPSTGRLYRNDWNSQLKHPVFTDVSKAAGVTIEGYGHGVSIADFNLDGWKDIFVTNDFNSNDLLYINNHDGSFTDKASTYFKHTSANGMGQDVIDVNNDGLSDVVELDMNPEDNYRKKTMLNASSYRSYQNSDYFGYQYQYVRNSLQFNQGPRVTGKDSIGEPVFSDIGFFSGIAETDWSWTPLVQDFDNDGYRDIIITNGFPKDVTDHDFIAFRRESYDLTSKKFALDQIPQVKIKNYAFHNNGDLTFTNATSQWGLGEPLFSNGAAYADLDNDGDLDVIINNINDEASLYENTSMNNHPHHYLNIQLKGDSLNRNGLGAWIEIHYGGKQQVYEQSPYRGYLSTMPLNAHFGLDTISRVDSLIIKWPNGKKQLLTDLKTDQTIAVDIKNANGSYHWDQLKFADDALFKDVTDSSGIQFVHQETDFIDFDRERLLPHKLSQYGPGLAAGDIDGNGLDDIIVGGSADYAGKIFLQQADGKFLMKDMPTATNKSIGKVENMGLLLFDADGDGDLDLYCANGSDEFHANTRNYQDQLFLNNGKGIFTIDSTALPINYTSKSCIRAVDFDNDGDLDLFIGGRCLPGKYPLSVSSFIYRNDSKNGKIKFTDVTADVAKDLQNLGMVCDAVWTDFDDDGWNDLIIAGEWMPITFFKNNHGKLQNITEQTGINKQTGWWNSITAGDFDNDGDIDYIVGNLGENSFFRASDEYPVNVYAKDFDKNGSLDAIVTVFLKDKDGVKKEYPALNRDDIVSQLPPLKKKFLKYKDFASADIHEMFTEEEMKGAMVLHVNNFKSCFIKNNGKGKFEMYPLPAMAQLGPLNGMVADDFNNDGNLDVAITGNDYGNEVTDGRYDALNGLVLLGDGEGNFKTETILRTGLFIPGDAKALIKLKGNDDNYILAASQNKGPLKIFSHKNKIQKLIPLQSFDVSALLTYKNGKKQKHEISYGSSFMSQSSRFLSVDNNIISVEIRDSKGKMRKISLQ